MREGQLFRRRRAAVRLQFRARDLIDHVARHNEPREAKRRCEDLACGAHVHHVVWRKALQRANRFPVVAILRVVVVFDDERPLPHRPVEQGGSALRSEHGTGRVLVGGRDQDSADIQSAKPIDREALVVDWNMNRLQPALLDVRALVRVPWILDRHPAHAALAQHAAHQADALSRSIARTPRDRLARRSHARDSSPRPAPGGPARRREDPGNRAPHPTSWIARAAWQRSRRAWETGDRSGSPGRKSCRGVGALSSRAGAVLSAVPRPATRVANPPRALR